jgi:hypothetical protein
MNEQNMQNQENQQQYLDLNRMLTLETLLFNTAVRTFNNEGIPLTVASMIMRSVAGRIDNMANQALIEENMQLQNALSKLQIKDHPEGSEVSE